MGTSTVVAKFKSSNKVKEGWLQPTFEIIMKSFVCPNKGQKKFTFDVL